MTGRRVPAAWRDLLGLADDATQGEATEEAVESAKALGAFQDIFPMLDGDGLADYLLNLADRCRELADDRDAFRATLARVHAALEDPS